MPSIFTSQYVTFGLIGGLFVLLMTFASLLMLMLIGGYCYCLYQSRKIPKRFAGNRRHAMITDLPLPYGHPSDIALMIWLQSGDPSTRLIQHVDSDDSNSTGSSRNLISQGQRLLLPPPPNSCLGSSRRNHSRTSQRSSGYSSRSDGQNRTNPSIIVSGEHSGSERQNQNRRRQARDSQSSYSSRSNGRDRARSSAILSREDSESERRDRNRRRQTRSSQRSDEYAPRSKGRHRTRPPESSSRDGSRSDGHVRSHRSSNTRSRSPHVGHTWNPESSRERCNRRGSWSEQWGSLSSDGRPGLADEATG